MTKASGSSMDDSIFISGRERADSAQGIRLMNILFGDLNRDHQLLHEAILVGTPHWAGGIVKRLLSYSIPSSKEWSLFLLGGSFLPNWLVNISTTLRQKLRAFAHYSSEIPLYSHPRSFDAVENQAKFWGSSVGFEYAEPFTC